MLCFFPSSLRQLICYCSAITVQKPILKFSRFPFARIFPLPLLALSVGRCFYLFRLSQPFPTPAGLKESCSSSDDGGDGGPELCPGRGRGAAVVYSRHNLQKIIGFGGAFTDAATINFFKLPQDVQEKVCAYARCVSSSAFVTLSLILFLMLGTSSFLNITLKMSGPQNKGVCFLLLLVLSHTIEEGHFSPLCVCMRSYSCCCATQ